MKATRNINGKLHIFMALCDLTESGEYEDDILRHDWLTQADADERNKEFREKNEQLRWVPEHIEMEDQPEDTPSLDPDLHC